MDSVVMGCVLWVGDGGCLLILRKGYTEVKDIMQWLLDVDMNEDEVDDQMHYYAQIDMDQDVKNWKNTRNVKKLERDWKDDYLEEMKAWWYSISKPRV